MSRDRKPLLADGSIVGDYTPLFKYWEKARRAGRREAADRVVLSHEDFDYLDSIVRGRGRLVLEEVLNVLEEYFERRVDAEIAVEAVKEAYGLPDYDEAESKRIIARILAGWLVEAAKTWGSIRFSGPGETK